MSISKFNTKYKTEIAENSNELDFLSKKIGDEGLKALCLIKFKNLDQLLLEENDIQSIDYLPKNNFGKSLKALDLSTNKISNIEALAKVDFPNLNHLFLTSNLITSIEIFAKVKFPHLIELNLSANKIESITILSKVNFPKLIKLDLSKNQISDISVFESVKFPELEDCLLQGLAPPFLPV